jgi:hypothetical protein
VPKQDDGDGGDCCGADGDGGRAMTLDWKIVFGRCWALIVGRAAVGDQIVERLIKGPARQRVR